MMQTLSDAASAILAQIETLAATEETLAADLQRAQAHRADLTRAVTGIGRLLETATRSALLLRLTRAEGWVEGPGARRGAPSDKVDAVMDYLAASTGVVSVAEVQRFLQENELTHYYSAAATMLSRKAKQGVVERIGRGRYKVNRLHRDMMGRGTPSSISGGVEPRHTH